MPRGTGGDDRGRRATKADVDAVLDGLSQQGAAFAALADTQAADELAHAEIARIAWTDRARAVDRLSVELPDGRVLQGRVKSVYVDGLVLSEEPGEWVIRAQAVHSIMGLGWRTRSGGRVEQRLTMASCLREWARDAVPVTCLTERGSREGTLQRVGLDHVDLVEHPRDSPGDVTCVRTIPLGQLWAVRCW